MDNYFVLELDTTSPTFDIIAPSYTNSDIKTEIRIEANEVLLNYQEIYLIDSEGQRIDVTFSYEGVSCLIGELYFNNFPVGITTIYCRLKDEVGNISALISKPINIIKGENLKLEIDDFVRLITLDEKTSALQIDEMIRKINLDSKDRLVECEEKISKIELELLVG